MSANMEPVLGVHPDNMDTTVLPSADFYRFANGRWLDQNPIPAEYSRWGAFEQLHELSQAQLHAVLDEAVGSSAPAAAAAAAAAAAVCAPEDGRPPSSLEHEAVHRALIGVLYATGMDEGACERAGFAPMRDVYEAIDACGDASALVALVATLAAERGVDAGFMGVDASPDAKRSDWVVLHLGQHGILGIGDRDFYLDADKRHIRDQYRDHVARMLTLAAAGNDSDSEADAHVAAADALLDLETRIAQKCMTKTEHRDPHKTYNMFDSVAALAESTGTIASIPWSAFFKGLGLGTEFGGIIVDNVALVQELGNLLHTVPLDCWKTYVRFHATSSMAPYLGKDAEEEHFNFHVKVMTGQPQMKPRWKRVITHVGAHLEESLAILYVARYFSPQAKKACKEMVDILVDVVRTRIDEVEWMSAETKKRAHAKLARFRAKIGYPDRWDLEHIPELIKRLSRDQSYAENVRAANAVQARRMLKRINKPVDPERWEMPPFIINAYFHPTRNEIVFPSAILQQPFFSAPTADMPHGDVPINFAAIGAVICHEISHGYDDQGRKYDENGELNDWWTEEDSSEYMRRAKLLVEQFAGYNVFGVQLNGELCLGENVADLGGVKLAYIGLQRFMSLHGRPADVDGFTPEQRFFLGWATVWRNNIRKENALKRIVMDPHSPGEFRANGPLEVLPEFHKAFDVKEGDPMYRPEELRCEIW